MQVAKWGDSLAVRIPRDVIRALDLKEGGEVQVTRAPLPAKVLTPDQRERALKKIQSLRGRLPADFKFDREEANARR